MSLTILNHIIIVLSVVLFTTVLFRIIRLPVVLGYLMVGALFGPHAFGVIKDIVVMQNLASFGVVFLMFTVGLEFSLSKLIALRRSVFLLGGLQALISMVLVFILMKSLGMTWHASLIIGGVIAMSSTAIVSKQLSENFELNSKHGLNAVGILLFQDLAVIPLLIMVTSPMHQHISHVLVLALLKAFIAIASIVLISHFLLKPIFRLIAGMRVMELFTLLVLLVAISAGWLTHYLGMSFALGAFLAGMMLAETQYRNQIEIEIRPFRDILMGMFFVAIGMLVNLHAWTNVWFLILIVFLSIIIGKSLLIALLSKLFGDDWATSARCGLILAQGGEFGFALLTVAFKNQLLTPVTNQILLGALILSIIITPILIRYNRKIVGFIFRNALVSSENKQLKHINLKTRALRGHVIICGYGPIGQNLSHILHQEKIPYFALDLDPRRIENANLAGENISYGDATHPIILETAGIYHAKAIVICFKDMRATQKILHYLKNTNMEIPIIVRCKNDHELIELQALGAKKGVSESRETSLMIAFQLLLALQKPIKEATNFINNIRKKHADLLEETFVSSFPKEDEEFFSTVKQLRSVVLASQAFAVNHSLEELSLHRFYVRVVALRRRNNYYEHPQENMKIHAQDILILYGFEKDLELAENFLLVGDVLSQS